MVLLIDNYDSFTYNVAHALAAQGAVVEVVRNDAIRAPQELLARRPARIVISPGPGHPRDAGVSLALVQAAAKAHVPVLGICLGMQAVAVAFGGRLVRLEHLVHGSASAVLHDSRGCLARMPQAFAAGRYHSLAVDPTTLPDVLQVTARTEDGVVMAIRHRSLPIEGVQFHPESVLTPRGADLFAAFVHGEAAA